MRLGFIKRTALFTVGFPFGLALGLCLLASVRVGVDLGVPPEQRVQFWPVAEAVPPVAPPAPPEEINPASEDLSAVQDALVAAAARAKEATVLVLAADHQARAFAVGSGVIVSADGLVLTAGHVIGAPGEKVEVVLADGTELTGESLGLSLYSDAGMLKITAPGDEPLPFIPIVDPSEEPAEGDWVFALGHPGGLDDERGVVLRLGHVAQVLDAFTFITTCRLLGGDSGGPLVDLSGRLVGIHSRISESIDGNYHARTAAFLRRWDALSDGRVLGLDSDQGFVGVKFQANVDAPVIVGFEEASPAREAELRVGDIFTHIDDDRVSTATEFASLIAERFSGETVSLGFMRDGIPATVEVSLVAAPEESEAPEEAEAR